MHGAKAVAALRVSWSMVEKEWLILPPINTLCQYNGMTKKYSKNKVLSLQKALLAWFDSHRRVMPWRALKGKRPDPYHVWLSEIMLQQTTVAAVTPYFERFIKRWPKVSDLAKATQDDVMAQWAGLGYYARARNLHKCAQAVVASGGRFPRDIDGLLELPGIGPYTAAAIASIAFDLPAVAVDGNVERVVSRFCAITEPLPASKPAMRQAAATLADGVERPGDFTQAFMELGATVCTPRNPQCGLCPWRKDCEGRALDIAATLPRKAAKKARPSRFGHAYVVTDTHGRVLIEKRQSSGLYEGMYQLPTTQWPLDKSLLPAPNDKAALVDAGLQAASRITSAPVGEVRHVLTHFDFYLSVHALHVTPAVAAKLQEQGERRWVRWQDLPDYGIPQVMTKALALVRPVARRG